MGGVNRFGLRYTFTTFGESHGPQIGVVIDGCPAGLELSEADIQAELDRRAPGNHPFASPRKEPDCARIVSGVFEGITTGAPIAVVIENRDVDSSKYEAMKDLLRPGHANGPYLAKYGHFDWRGGGRASARETVGRVIAGAIAKKLLKDITITAHIDRIGPHLPNEALHLLQEVKDQGDSIGGIIRFEAHGVPAGLGDPIYQRLDARLSYALMSIPSTKGVEIGSGFEAALMRGSQCNDLYESATTTATNHSGGILAGISNGMPIFGRVAFKPTSSIAQPQATVTTTGQPATLELPPGSRHDPCQLFRALPIVEAMVAVVLADAWLLNRTSKL